MTDFANTLRRLRRSLRRRGLTETLRQGGARLLLRARRESALLDAVRAQDGTFDEDYNVQTSGFIKLNDLQVESSNWIDATDYRGTSPSLFREMLGRLDIDHRRFTFIDVGAGKGRALLLAAALPFESVIGVEFVPALCEVAARNFETYTGPRACENLEIVCADADAYELPRSPLVIFLYNPFARPLMSRFAAKLVGHARETGFPACILYCNPEQAPVFETPAFEALAVGPAYRVYKTALPVAAGA